MPPGSSFAENTSRWVLYREGLYKEDYGICGLVVPREKMPSEFPSMIANVYESLCGILFIKKEIKRKVKMYLNSTIL